MNDLTVQPKALLQSSHGIAWDTEQNSSFSRLVPGLQLGVDSTSLGEFKQCPRKYFYSIVAGYQPRQLSVHLAFGLWLHAGVELYHRRRFAGAGHEDALDAVVEQALRATWNSKLQRPWTSDHPQKNRVSLLRALVWYLDQFQDDPLQVQVLPNGQPAVELTFKFDSQFRSTQGEQVVFCGHMDRIGKLQENLYIADVKTTVYTLGPGYFAQFDPDNQFSLYSLAGRVAFGQPVKGVIVDAMQIGVNFVRFHRHPVSKDDAKLEEWVQDSHEWLGRMEHSARKRAWPMNDKACGLYGGCPFREVCGSSPKSRPADLDRTFRRRVWDPFQARGDI